MKNGIKKIFQVFDAQKDHLAQQTIAVDKEKLNEILSSFYSPGTSIQYILDHWTREFNYVSENIQEVIGVQASDFTPERLYETVHPDDLEYVRKCEEIAWFFLSKVIDKSEIPFYKISYQYRIKNKLGKYNMNLHQAIAIAVDEKGHLSSVFGNESDISHITTTNNYKISFIDVRGEKSYFNITNKNDLLKPGGIVESITGRELEILRLLSEGYSSKEIASHLHISYDTVRTHRNNILKKTKFRTLTHVISHYIKEGIL